MVYLWQQGSITCFEVRFFAFELQFIAAHDIAAPGFGAVRAFGNFDRKRLGTANERRGRCHEFQFNAGFPRRMLICAMPVSNTPDLFVWHCIH